MSFISTYQSCKTLLANKLTEYGVTASEIEGLTTLINKIQNLEPIGSGTFIVSDKKSVGDNETVKFTGVVLGDNGGLVESEDRLIRIIDENDTEIFSNTLTSANNLFSVDGGAYMSWEVSSDGITYDKVAGKLTSVGFDFNHYEYSISFDSKTDDNVLSWFGWGTGVGFWQGLQFSVSTQNASFSTDTFYNIKIILEGYYYKLYFNNVLIEQNMMNSDFFTNNIFYLIFEADDWVNTIKNLQIKKRRLYGKSNSGIVYGQYTMTDGEDINVMVVHDNDYSIKNQYQDEVTDSVVSSVLSIEYDDN